MIRSELINKSPIRTLEKITYGGVKKGNIGVIAAKKGVGKTACLVHIATDQLLSEKHVIHISFSANTSHILTWYEDIFNEIARRNNLEDAMELHDHIVRNRIIMNFTQNGIHITQIEKSIQQLIKKGNFSADTLVIDGYDFSISSKEELREFRQFASELNLALWFSASVKDETEKKETSSIPQMLEDLAPEISVIIFLEPKEDHIHLNLVKNHDASIQPESHLKLDPKILLIAEEN